MVVPIVSPCIRVCRIDPATQICEGCDRTLAEIAAWSKLAPQERAAIMAALPLRRARASNRTATQGKTDVEP